MTADQMRMGEDLAGVLITMEGVEGAGKSTQIARLVEKIRGNGVPCLVSKEPGGTMLGRELRTLLLAPHASGERWCPEAELLLFYADRAQHMAQVVRPALVSGKVVVLDRFEDSTWAYQGAQGVEEACLNRLRHVVLGSFRPDLTLVLDMDPAESLRRVGARNAALGESFRETRFDEASLAFHERVRERFLAIARQEPDRVVVLPAQETPGAVADAVWENVAVLLRQHGFQVA